MKTPKILAPFIVAACALLLPVDGTLLAASSFQVSPLLVTHTGEPGSRVSGQIRVVNAGAEPTLIRIHLEDFVTDSDGADTWNPPAGRDRSMRDWISFSPSYLEVPAESEAYIQYEIEIPSSAEEGQPLEGSHWVGLKVQSDPERRALFDETAPQRGTRVGMRVALVYAVKIYVDIAGTERPRLESVDLEAADKPGSLIATFANRGNVLLRPRVWMEVRDARGAVLGTVEALRWSIQPNTDHRYLFSLRDLPDPIPDGEYQVVVISDYGGERLQGLSAPLVLESDSR